MGRLSDARLLGGIGSILMLLTILPNAGIVVGIVGAVLVLIAVKYISEKYNDKQVFNNMLLAVILLLAGFVAGVGVVIGGFASFIFSAFTISSPIAMAGVLFPIALFIAGLIIIWIMMLVSSIFLKRSFDRIATLVNVNLFSTSALLYVIGAGLTIILIGFIIVFIAIILQTIAFFSISEEEKPVNIPE